MLVCNAEDVVRRIEAAGGEMQKTIEVYILRGACKKAAAGDLDILRLPRNKPPTHPLLPIRDDPALGYWPWSPVSVAASRARPARHVVINPDPVLELEASDNQRRVERRTNISVVSTGCPGFDSRKPPKR
jgi:hypothetical protein